MELKKHAVLFVVLLIDIVVSLFATDKQFASGMLYAVVCYFSLFWIIILNNTFLQNEEAVVTIYKFGIFSGVLFAIYSFMPFAYYRDNNTVSPTLTLYFGNSNLAGIYIFAAICIIMIYIRSSKKKGLVGILLAYLLYLLWMTGVRTCMIAAIFVITSAILPAKTRIPKLIVVGCFAFPIAFVPAYLKIFKSGYADLVIMGKRTLFGTTRNIF